MNTFNRGASHIAVTAALSVALLLAAIGAEVGERSAAQMPMPEESAPIHIAEYIPTTDSDNNGLPDWRDELIKGGFSMDESTSTSATTTPHDPLATLVETTATSLFNSYLNLKMSGGYTEAGGKSLAEQVATQLVKAPPTFILHTEDELTVDDDVSLARILLYRADMRKATEPLLEGTEPEFALFGRYMETGDPHWLNELQIAVERYRAAEKNMLEVTVPKSANVYHLRAINATGAYADNIDRLIRYAGDPMAVLALLRAYNDVEREMLLAFDALAQFYARSATQK